MTTRNLAARCALFVIGVLCVALGPSQIVSACSCGPVSEAEALEIADAVFVGEATAVDDSEEFDEPFVVRYTMDVERVYKGSAFETQSLVTPQRGGACGLEMETGVPWVIYATRPGELDDTRIDDTELASDICTASRPVDAAGVAASLGDGDPPTEGASATSGDGDDSGGIPGVVFGIGFVVVAVVIIFVGTRSVQRRRIE